MDVKFNKLETVKTNVVKLEFSVSAADFDAALAKAYQKQANRFQVPGFRKGKAPQAMVERYYGEAAFYESAIDIVFPEAYTQVIMEQGINPVSQPSIDIGENIGRGKGCDFIVEVTVRPEVKLGQYKELETKKASIRITEKEIMAEINKVAEKNARLVNVEDRAAQNGDITTIDYRGLLDGVAFEGGTAENQELTLGSGKFIPGFEEQIVGHNIGEEFNINVTFPAEYGAENLAGKAVVFEIKLHAIKVRELPAIDDEFASDVSEFDTLDAYKADVKKQLRKDAEEKARKELETTLIEMAVANAEMEIPEVMYHNQVNAMLEDMDMRLRYQGMSLEQYMQYMGITADKLHEIYMPQAEKSVKARLVIEQIIKEENIVVTDDEVMADIEKKAEEYGNKDEFMKYVNDELKAEFADQLKSQKAIALLVDNVKYTK
ncbi:MAG: trigger factor [Clostridia bacterium]|nr:trigger factor [Clostridia bacterium]